MRSRSTSLHPPILALSILLALGCSDDPIGPFQPEIANLTDNFQLQATGVASVTNTLSYSWANTGTRATINHSTTTTAGSAQLTIRDAAGTTVYDKNLAPSLNEATTVGMPGTWTIQLRLTNYGGTLNFRAQKL